MNRACAGRRVLKSLACLICAAIVTVGCEYPFGNDLYDLTEKKAEYAPSPAFSPGAGGDYDFTVEDAPSHTLAVSLSCSQSGAIVHYALDGGEFSVYANPRELTFDPLVAQSWSIRAYATHPDFEDSETITRVFSFVPLTVPTPTVASSTGSFAFTVATVPTVTLACALSGAAIHYSLDAGATWTDYTAPFALPTPANIAEASTVTVLAKATRVDYLPSATASQAFAFTPTVAPSGSARITWSNAR